MNTCSGAVKSFSKNDTTPSSLSHSSTEAEIKAIDEWIREVIHIIDIVSYLCADTVKKPVKLFVDNKSAIELCETLKQNHKVKHINLRIHYIREVIEAGLVELHFCPSEFNVADMLTKALAGPHFEALRDILFNGHKGIMPGNWSDGEVHCAITAEVIRMLCT